VLSFLWQRTGWLAAVLAIAAVAGWGLYQLMSRAATLQQTVHDSSQDNAAAFSRLVAGLAHEIRNPLHAIQLNLHTLRVAHQRGLELPPEDLTRMLAQCSGEIERIERLVQQLVTFAAVDPPRPELADLSAEVRTILDFIDGQLQRDGVQVEARLAQAPVPVMIDRARLRQVMLNLLQNSQQAMDQGGDIVVCVSRNGDTAHITVDDAGGGVPEALRQRVFEPFFSTKSGGAGLGLAVAKRFVEEAQGRICCEPMDGRGARFRIQLPLAREQA
jgi:signal transduction histidine kinase